jgi:uncharacterized membrane protein YoaK (UPF0700 family)
VSSDTVPASERTQKRQGRSLTLIAGYLDGYGLLVVGTYVSFMSGNTTMAGRKIGEADFLAALSPMIAIACFVTGGFIANLVTHSQPRRAYRPLFCVIAALLTFVLLFVLKFGHEGLLRNPSIAALALGMGMTNPVLGRIGGRR